MNHRVQTAPFYNKRRSKTSQGDAVEGAMRSECPTAWTMIGPNGAPFVKSLALWRLVTSEVSAASEAGSAGEMSKVTPRRGPKDPRPRPRYENEPPPTAAKS
jgi:hypothetical protein